MSSSSVATAACSAASRTGSVEIVDLTPADAWRPAVNGITRRQALAQQGRRTSASGSSAATTASRVKGEGDLRLRPRQRLRTLLGVPGLLSSDTGIYSTDLEADCQEAPDQCQAIPLTLTRVPFGKPDTTMPHP